MRTRRLMLQLRRPVFYEEFPNPRAYTADGQNRSLPLIWNDHLEETECFAVFCEDSES